MASKKQNLPFSHIGYVSDEGEVKVKSYKSIGKYRGVEHVKLWPESKMHRNKFRVFKDQVVWSRSSLPDEDAMMSVEDAMYRWEKVDISDHKTFAEWARRNKGIAASKGNDMLKFASEREALQHLSDITGKKVIVALYDRSEILDFLNNAYLGISDLEMKLMDNKERMKARKVKKKLDEATEEIRNIQS